MKPRCVTTSLLKLPLVTPFGVFKDLTQDFSLNWKSDLINPPTAFWLKSFLRCWCCSINTISTWLMGWFNNKWNWCLTQEPLKNVADSSAVDLWREKGLKKHRRRFVLGQLRQQPGHTQTKTNAKKDKLLSSEFLLAGNGVAFTVITQGTRLQLSPATRPPSLGCPAV